jgi:hypothetical protein
MWREPWQLQNVLEESWLEGYKVEMINNKRSNVQDNICKYVIKRKQCPSVVFPGFLLLDHITLT